MGKRYVHEIGDMLEYVGQYSTSFNVTVTDVSNNQITLADTKTVVDFFDTLYWDRVFIAKEENIEDAEKSFERIYKSYMKRYEKDFSLMYQALYDYKYSPIENYNRFEDTLVENGGKDTTSTNGAEKQTSTNTIEYGSKDTRTDDLHATATSEVTDNNSGEDAITKKDSGFNQPDSLHDSEKQVTMYGKQINTNSTTTTENTSSQLNAKSGQDTSSVTSENTNSNTNETTYGATMSTTSNIHGNVGVTTNQSMIVSEIQMRSHNLLENILERFINLYTVYM